MSGFDRQADGTITRRSDGATIARPSVLASVHTTHLAVLAGRHLTVDEAAELERVLRHEIDELLTEVVATVLDVPLDQQGPLR